MNKNLIWAIPGNVVFWTIYCAEKPTEVEKDGKIIYQVKRKYKTYMLMVNHEIEEDK